MIDAPLALALTAGMVGAINPCAFSLLPAYIGLFVAGDDRDSTLDRRLIRAAGSAIGVTIGFVVVFVTLGVLLDSIADRFREDFPWVTIGVGALLMLAGVAAVFGWNLRVAMPTLRAAGYGGSAGMVIYGAIYALASLSCTIGPFLAITAVAMDRSVTSGLATYVTYSLGMGVVILAIAAASALTRPRPIAHLRWLSRYAGLMGGTLMILSGAYAVWYGKWELSVYGGDLDDDRIVNAGESLRSDMIRLIERAGALRLTITVLAIITAAIIALRIGRSPDVKHHMDDESGVADANDDITNVGSASRLKDL